MKLITSLIGIGALSFATLALAQKTQSTSPAPEEKSSTTTEATSTAAPETTTATTQSEQPAAQRKEKPATTPASTQKRAVTAKAPSPVAASASRKTSVEETLKGNENRWEASYAGHDPSVAQALVAGDFEGVYWDGRVMGKSGVISEMKKDKDTYKSAVNEKLAVHSYGPNVAVVIGTTHEKGTGQDGKPFDRAFRFTDTWVQRGGQWQCVASHVMKVKG